MNARLEIGFPDVLKHKVLGSKTPIQILKSDQPGNHWGTENYLIRITFCFTAQHFIQRFSYVPIKAVYRSHLLFLC